MLFAAGTCEKRAERNKDRMTDPRHCTGCSACAAICPRGCITMQPDAQGFSKPVRKSENCTDCGLCEKICPVLHEPDRKETEKIYAAYAKSEALRNDSSSGGVFGVLAQQVLAEGGVVFGAYMNEARQVVHGMAQSSEELAALRGSKYVQSALGDCFAQVKSQLSAGRTVLFSGTPCQIAGLTRYLGKPYDNLLTVDLICHGVPSPMVWREYLACREKDAGARAVGASFRDKVQGWNCFSMKLRFANGRQYAKSLHEDSYLRGFLANLFLNDACSDCRFKGTSRCGDVTLADFWGVEKMLPALKDDKGVSLLLVRSAAAARLLRSCKERLHILEVPMEEALQCNTAATHSVQPHRNRARFFAGLSAGKSFDRLTESCLRRPFYRRVLSKMKRLLRGKQ